MSLIPPSAADESALLAGLRAGEASAYEQLVRLYGGRLLSTAQRLLGNEQDACDALQEAYLAAFKSIGSFEGGAKISTWLHRIVVNCALMKLRSKSRKQQTSIEDLLPTYFDDGHRRNPGPAFASPPEAMLERAEICQLVRQCISKLPEDYRNVLMLRDIEEMDTEETAKVLGITAGAVKTRLHRARQALQTLLEREVPQ
jgi:RNA polymerase sigma-70 factor (ECF subfamily)